MKMRHPKAASNASNRRYGVHGHVYMHYFDKILERLRMCDRGDAELLARLREGGIYTSAPEGNVRYAPDDPWREKPPPGQQVYELVLYSETHGCPTIYAKFGNAAAVGKGGGEEEDDDDDNGMGSLWFSDPRPLSKEGRECEERRQSLRLQGYGYLLD